MRDLRRYANQTNFRLIVGGLLLLFIVGDGLIYIIYGSAAAISGLLPGYRYGSPGVDPVSAVDY